MLIFSYLAVIGLVVVSLAACDLYGLPKVSRLPYLPHTTSQAVLAAQPPEALVKVDPAARAARAEAPPKHVTQQPIGHQQHYLVDRFSAKDQ